MKRQYLGDSKDCFKWDYHNFLVSGLAYRKLNIALMLTPDDGSNDGQSHPALFPANPKVVEFCEDLVSEKNIDILYSLPQRTAESYDIELHNKDMTFRQDNRQDYFDNLELEERQVLLIDPDNGFEPKRSRSEKHIGYDEIRDITHRLSMNAVVSVFQHHRRKKFDLDFDEIKEKIDFGYVTALYWHALMFVIISRSRETIDKIAKLNIDYATMRPVTLLNAQQVL